MAGAPRVVGVDACRKGWVGIASDGRGYFGETVGQLVTEADDDGPVSVLAVDIPIGLASTSMRQADLLARGRIGRRRQSVFMTPVREALTAATHAEATAINAAATGKGISQQAFALRAKILEVDAWARVAGRPVLEAHPEVCFAEMAQRPLAHPKSTWAGVEERRTILDRAGIRIAGELGRAGELAGVDDVLDAAAVGWTAARYAAGRAFPIPDPPEDLGDGLAAAIWV